mmetsp:Transcript_3869/g.6038  ORF Transcript_3869/g.6038 Transcript_3869/m.6038 type:complete len:444 (-) Transcript_3869:198-1529(-)
MDDSLTPQLAKKMKVSELKNELTARGAPTSGLKAVLLERLLDIIDKEKADEGDTNAGETATEMEDAENGQDKSDDVDTCELQDRIVTTAESAADKITDAPQAADTLDKPEMDKAEMQADENTAEVEHGIDSAETEPADAEISMQDESEDEEASKNRIVEDDKTISPEETQSSLQERTSSDLSTATTSHTSPTTATCHLRIDNFQRPLNMRSLCAWLSEKSGTDLDEKNIWLNSIKTHCYVTFDCAETAAKCRDAVQGEKFPLTNSNVLEADFTSVPAAEASSSAEAALRAHEWKAVASTAQPSPRAAPATQSNGSSLGKRKLLPASRSGGMFGVLRNTLQTAAAAASGGPSQKSPRMERSNSGRVIGNISESADGGFTTHRKVDPVVEERPEPVEPTAKESVGTSLEDLFRKTTTVPQLFWLPVPEEQVKRRIEKKMQASSQR